MFNVEPSLVLTDSHCIQKGLKLILVDSKSPSFIFNLKEHAENDRHEVEQFISTCFLKGHGVTLNHFMPRIFSLRTRENELIAAFGLRLAANSRLFLEHYLNAPIEKVLKADFDILTRRNCIVEVGNLSATYAGATRLLIIAMTALLYKEGYEWVTFTATSAVRNVFYRLGLEPIELSDARKEQLPIEEQANWGTYYDNSPIVMVGNIEQGHSALRSKISTLRELEQSSISNNLMDYS